MLSASQAGLGKIHGKSRLIAPVICVLSLPRLVASPEGPAFSIRFHGLICCGLVPGRPEPYAFF